MPMLLSEAALCVASLGLLLLAGWAFVNTRLYREESDRDACAQARAHTHTRFAALTTRAAARTR